MSPSVAFGLAITVLALVALWVPVAAERRIAAMVHSRRVDAELRGIVAAADKDLAVLSGFGVSAMDAAQSLAAAFGVPPRPCEPFGQCPMSSCNALGYHLFIRRDGNLIRRECRSCGVQWTEAL